MLGMKKLVLALWCGDVPLRRVFWEYAVLYGTLLNLVTTLISLVVLQAEGLEVVAVAIFLLPMPYNVFMVIAVWRSASRYEGPEKWAQIARIAAIVWAVLASLA